MLGSSNLIEANSFKILRMPDDCEYFRFWRSVGIMEKSILNAGMVCVGRRRTL